jgi:hypothetical protein
LSDAAALEAAVPPERGLNIVLALMSSAVEVFAALMGAARAWLVLELSPFIIEFQKSEAEERFLSPRFVAKPPICPISPIFVERFEFLPVNNEENQEMAHPPSGCRSRSAFLVNLWYH